MDMLPNYHQEKRPWGDFEQFTLNEPCTVKILHVEAGKRFSLQRHAHRTEFWKVLAGKGTAEVDTDIRHVTKDDVIPIPKNSLHRLTAGVDGLWVLEVAFGVFDESDIERIEDDFGRVPQ